MTFIKVKTPEGVIDVPFDHGATLSRLRSTNPNVGVHGPWTIEMAMEAITAELRDLVRAMRTIQAHTPVGRNASR